MMTYLEVLEAIKEDLSKIKTFSFKAEKAMFYANPLDQVVLRLPQQEVLFRKGKFGEAPLRSVCKLAKVPLSYLTRKSPADQAKMLSDELVGKDLLVTCERLSGGNMVLRSMHAVDDPVLELSLLEFVEKLYSFVNREVQWDYSWVGFNKEFLQIKLPFGSFKEGLEEVDYGMFCYLSSIQRGSFIAPYISFDNGVPLVGSSLSAVSGENLDDVLQLLGSKYSLPADEFIGERIAKRWSVASTELFCSAVKNTFPVKIKRPFESLMMLEDKPIHVLDAARMLSDLSEPVIVEAKDKLPFYQKLGSFCGIG